MAMGEHLSWRSTVLMLAKSNNSGGKILGSVDSGGTWDNNFVEASWHANGAAKAKHQSNSSHYG